MASSLAHIIGFEQCSHDNSCGLAGFTAVLVVFQQHPYAMVKYRVESHIFCVLIIHYLSNTTSRFFFMSLGHEA
jgi:hypothetical protein